MCAHSLVRQPLLLTRACAADYQRDALLKAVVGRAGFQHLIEETEAEQKQPLAKLPEALARFDLENFRDRLVQTELVAKLLLPKDDPAFTSCIIVHGMGGTGKVSGPWRCLHTLFLIITRALVH